MTTTAQITADPQTIEEAMCAGAQLVDRHVQAAIYVLCQHRDYLLREDLYGPTLTWSEDRSWAVPACGALYRLVRSSRGPVMCQSARTMVSAAASLGAGGAVELVAWEQLDRIDAHILATAVLICAGVEPMANAS